MSSLHDVRAARAEAVRVAKEALGGSLDLFVGMRRIVNLWDLLALGADHEDDLGVLLDVAAETEDLPIGAERAAWPQKLLLESDRELARLRKLYREDLVRALHRLVLVLADDPGRGAP